MSFLMAFQLSFAQKTVSGTVTDDNSVPLPGATVIVEGTSNGVTMTLMEIILSQPLRVMS